MRPRGATLRRPFHFAYDDHALYSFATVGQKIEWMRANALVCVEASDKMTDPQIVAKVRDHYRDQGAPTKSTLTDA